MAVCLMWCLPPFTHKAHVQLNEKQGKYPACMSNTMGLKETKLHGEKKKQILSTKYFVDMFVLIFITNHRFVHSFKVCFDPETSVEFK